MSELNTIQDAPLTMSSREIAELCEKRHDNVMRDIRVMLVDLYGEGGVLSFEETQTNSQNGQTYLVFNLPKDLTITLIAGYNVKLRKRIIDRWIELEAQVAKPALDPMQILSDPATMRGLLLNYTEQVLTLQSKVGELAPKAQAFEMIAASKSALTYTEASKVLGMRRQDLVVTLHANGWHYRQNGSWVAYDRYIKNGCLQYKEAKYTDDNTGREVIRPYCHITQKGITRLAQLYRQEIDALL